MSTENKQFTEKEAPQGYWVDAKGVLTPESLIKDIDRARDSLVQEVIGRAIELNKALAEFKLSGFSDIGAFVDLSANEYGVSLAERKATSRSTALTVVTRFSAPCKTVSHSMSACRPLRR